MNKGRKIIAILLSVCLVISTICADAFVARSEAAEGEKTLKVLSIGNSFSQDAQRWIYQVAVDAGYEDVIFANLYWGGCSLWQHWSNAKSDYAGYEYQKNTTGAIEYTNMVSIKTAVMDEDWDYITLQQVSGLSGQADTYNSDLTNLISYVKEYATNPTEIDAYCYQAEFLLSNKNKSLNVRNDVFGAMIVDSIEKGWLFAKAIEQFGYPPLLAD